MMRNQSSNNENIRLIYLNNSEINGEFKKRLLEINPAALFYTDYRLCLDFIKTIYNEEILLIIPRSFLEKIYSFQSIVAIFIYDINHEEEISDMKIKYPKIIDRYTNEDDLLKSLQDKIQFIEKQFFIFSLFDNKQKLTRDLTKESASFLWYHMSMDILKQIPQDEHLRNEILNKYSLNELFQQTHTDKVLNHALRMKNIELLYLFGSSLLDLCLEIENECKHRKHQGHLIVYRAQIMSMKNIEKFQENIGNLISINGFLSTTYDKNISLEFLHEKFSNYENVLFQIQVDISQENEILFNINSIFKIESIEYDTMHSLWNIQMSSANHDQTKEINQYLKWIEKEMDYDNSLIYFGHILWNELGQLNQAENYFHILLKSFDISSIYIELGSINDERGEYNLALKNYQHALATYEKQIPKDYIRIALTLNKIGLVYKRMGNIDRAIDYYRQSSDIYQTKSSNNENWFYRSQTLTNLGLAYRDKKDFTAALIHLNLAYNLRRDVLPNDQSLLANSLNCIGHIYHDKKDFLQALNYYQQALTIQEQTCPNNHLNKSNTIRNIGLIYRDKQDYINALNYFNRTLDMRKYLLTNINHPDIAICYGDIGYIYEKLNNLDLAFEYYEKQYDIEETCLTENHVNLRIHLECLINILKKKDQIDKAIELCQEKLLYLKTCYNKTYENHPRTSRILILLANIYEDKNPKQADQYYQQALTILESNKNDEIFCKYLLTMTNFYWKCRMFDRALICQMKLLNHRRSTLLSNHNDIAYTLRDLARLYRAMNKTNEALEHFEQSLIILQTNYGLDHADVKNIQKEILDLKEIIKTLSSSANEDYNNRRISNAHKQLFLMSQIDIKTSTEMTKSSTSVLKSSTCSIL